MSIDWESLLKVFENADQFLARLKKNFGVDDAVTFVYKLCNGKPEYCGSAREALMVACGKTQFSKKGCENVIDEVMKVYCGKEKSSRACKNEAINKPPPPPAAPSGPAAPIAPIAAITEAAKEAATKGSKNLMLIGAIVAVVLVLVVGVGLMCYCMQGSKPPPPPPVAASTVNVRTTQTVNKRRKKKKHHKKKTKRAKTTSGGSSMNTPASSTKAPVSKKKTLSELGYP